MNSFFQTSKKATGKRRAGWIVWILRTFFNLALIFSVAFLVLVTGVYLLVVKDYGNRLDRRYPELAQNSYVYDGKGNRIGEFQAEQDRETVGPKGLGKILPKAVVATEDRRFYEHFGVDLEGVSRAAWTDLQARGVQEGGSTITEQLMKNLFIPEDDRARVSFWRRFVQSALAFDYERKHTKAEILTGYLNTVYFGDGAYGAQAATQHYFGESASDLNLSQAAALAGFLHAPSTYVRGSSAADVNRATGRRDEVLKLMKHQGYISVREYEKAKAAPLKFAPDPPPEDPAYKPFIEKVRREVRDHLGDKALKQGGLDIHTTLKPEMQHQAVETTKQTLPLSSDPSAAVVTVEPQSGAIRVLAGEKGNFNLALDARRQPGSSFKAFVLAAALKKGISPESIYLSRDLDIRFQDQDYSIRNYDDIQRGPISLYEAMAESDNTVFVQLAMEVGLKKVVNAAHDLGVKEPLDPYPSTAIGGLGTGVNALDMASAYATFAGGGVYREPYTVETVDHASYGKTESVYDHRLIGRRVMSGNEAAAATQVLREVVKSGTASRFHDLDHDIGLPSAGKTGTTDDFADAWYVGFTPRLSTAVWIGYPESRRSMVGVHGLDEVNGETLPLDLWATYMAQVTKGDPALDFPEPDLGEFTILDRSNPGS